jgi:hypothetical protein
MSALDLTCERAVDLVTDYMEGELGERDQLLYELHVVLCQPCKVHLDRMRRSIGALASLRGGALPVERRQSLVARFTSETPG